ncbi:MAG: tape measure protein, partial [Xanthomonadaceae bacterium]|nr:tape measure protein [Xanthomonadaceae bacterium]
MAGNKVEVEIAAKVSGEQSVDALGTALTETAGDANKLGTSASVSATGLNKADTAAKGLTGTSGQLSDGVKSVSTQLAEAKNQLLNFMGIQGLAGTVKDVAALADQWANMKSRLQLALGAQTDINAAMSDVEGVAKRTYTSLDATANLYGKIATAGKDMGVSQQQALAVTETINQTIQLSGASAQASEAAVTQLIQGLQSGVIRGDEFNSIMEQSPRLSKAMADGMNVPIGALRGLAEQGKLTSQTVIRSLQGQSDAIAQEFGALPVTIGRAVQSLQTEWLKFIGTLDGSTGASSAAAAGIQSIATHLDDLARVAAAAGAALTVSFAVQAAQALRAAAVQMAATGGAAALLRKNLDTLSRPVQITIAVTGFEVGYQIGTMLRENFALARQFGVGVVGFFELLVNNLQLLKEAAAAVFTDDTVNAALDRYIERNKTIGATLRDMFADAEKAPGAVGAAVDDAAAKTGALGTAAQTAGAAVA